MELGRLKIGEWILAVSAVALGVSLFLPWYHVAGVDQNAWETFTVIDIFLFALVVMAVLAVLRAADPRSSSFGIVGEGLVTPIAMVASIVVLVRFLNIPGDLEGIAQVSRGPGAWLGLISTFGVFVGALVAMRDEWIGSRPDPEIETLPAPSPDGGAAV